MFEVSVLLSLFGLWTVVLLYCANRNWYYHAVMLIFAPTEFENTNLREEKNSLFKLTTYLPYTHVSKCEIQYILLIKAEEQNSKQLSFMFLHQNDWNKHKFQNVPGLLYLWCASCLKFIHRSHSSMHVWEWIGPLAPSRRYWYIPNLCESLNPFNANVKHNAAKRRYYFSLPGATSTYYFICARRSPLSVVHAVSDTAP